MESATLELGDLGRTAAMGPFRVLLRAVASLRSSQGGWNRQTVSNSNNYYCTASTGFIVCIYLYIHTSKISICICTNMCIYTYTRVYVIFL